MAFKSSNLYCYYVKNHNAIKVGFGENSTQRMRDYSKFYNLEVDLSSLKKWKIPVSGLAQTVENSCHLALLDAGFQKHILSNEDGQEAQELFHLGGASYEDALLIVAGTIDETIENIVSKLGITDHKNIEKSRRKKEGIRLRKEQIDTLEKVEFNKKVFECSAYIVSVWSTKFQPVIDIFDRSTEIGRNFPYMQSTIKRLFEGKKSDAVRMYQWEKYPFIRTLIIDSFDIIRSAKAENVKIHDKFEKDGVLDSSLWELKLSIDRPCTKLIRYEKQSREEWKKTLALYGYSLPFVDSPLYSKEWAHLEVRLIVQLAVGAYYFCKDDATELIKLDPSLQELVARASSIYPAEHW